MTSQTLPITVENVGKKFCRTLRQSMKYASVDIAKEFMGITSKTHKLRNHEFWALKDINFDLNKDETLGIIGLNGSGKSTTLKLLNGIYMPDHGRIKINGRVGALIEVGAGFHPLLTGRENVYINGTILGLSKSDIDSKYDEIVDFAELHDFMDVPVRNYSSGMYVRLGFSVAVHCEPDILLVDEVLAVGDLSFRGKCISKIVELKSKTSTIFISHDLTQVIRLCDRVILLDNGNILEQGDPYDVVTKYNDLVLDKSVDPKTDLSIFLDSGDLTNFKVMITDSQGNPADEFNIHDEIQFHFHFDSKKEIINPVMGTVVKTIAENQVLGSNPHGSKVDRIKKGSNHVIYSIKNIPLLRGQYRIGFKWKYQNNKTIIFANSPTFLVKTDPEISFNRYGLVETNDSWCYG